MHGATHIKIKIKKKKYDIIFGSSECGNITSESRQALSRYSFTAEDRVQCQNILCGICDR
jgi:hypothetical protein